MPERKAFRTILNITACDLAHEGAGANGPYKIYEVKATNRDGVLVQEPLSTFAELPLGRNEYDLKPYMKGGQFKNWTVTPVKAKGAAANEAQEQRVAFLEQQMEFALNKISELTERMTAMERGQQQPAMAVGSTRHSEDDDVPF